MPLTDDGLTLQRDNFDGVQRIYELPNGYSVSMVNAPIFHVYPYAWEAGVLGPDGMLSSDTPLTDSVEVFYTDDEANAFLLRAFEWARGEKCN